jgi:hypothetical protein
MNQGIKLVLLMNKKQKLKISCKCTFKERQNVIPKSHKLLYYNKTHIGRQESLHCLSAVSQTLASGVFYASMTMTRRLSCKISQKII